MSAQAIRAPSAEPLDTRISAMQARDGAQHVDVRPWRSTPPLGPTAERCGCTLTDTSLSPDLVRWSSATARRGSRPGIVLAVPTDRFAVPQRNRRHTTEDDTGAVVLTRSHSLIGIRRQGRQPQDDERPRQASAGSIVQPALRCCLVGWPKGDARGVHVLAQSPSTAYLPS